MPPWDIPKEEFARTLVEKGMKNDSSLRKFIDACGGYDIVSVEVSND